MCGRRRRATGCRADRPGPTAGRGHRHTRGRLAPRPAGRSDSWRTLALPKQPPVAGLRPAAPVCWRVRSGGASNRRRWYRDRSLACSRLACGVDELRRGRPPWAARPFAPALAPTPALAGLWPGTCPGRVRGARPGSGRGAAVQGCRRWDAVLPLTVPVRQAGSPALPKLRRPRACGQRLRVQVPIRRYAPRRERPRRKWTGDSWWYPPIGFTDQSRHP